MSSTTEPSGPPSWSLALATALLRILQGYPETEKMRLSLDVTPMSVEIVFGNPGKEPRHGVRVTASDYEGARRYLPGLTIDELGALLALGGILEPRPCSDFITVDSDEIGWLPIESWLPIWE